MGYVGVIPIPHLLTANANPRTSNDSVTAWPFRITSKNNRPLANFQRLKHQHIGRKKPIIISKSPYIYIYVKKTYNIYI